MLCMYVTMNIYICIDTCIYMYIYTYLCTPTLNLTHLFKIACLYVYRKEIVSTFKKL